MKHRLSKTIVFFIILILSTPRQATGAGIVPSLVTSLPFLRAGL
jgi:hypothetical protein